MKATWEKIDKNLVALDVEVEAGQVNEALDKAFKKVVVKVNVPGFRKGKVPRGIFESRFGVESLYQDAIDILLPDAYSEAVKETGIVPVDRPDIEVDQFAKGQAFKFKAKVTVKPEVQLGEYKGLEVPAEEVNVSEEEITEELDRLQQRHAELTVIEEGAAEKGDVAVIDFDGYVDGEAFEGGKSERYSLELGSGSFIPGFEEQVIGMQTGDFKDVEVTFPESYHAENLAGKLAVFKVKLHEIKRKNLPALDDEFAKDVSEFDTLEEFKQDLVSKLAERKQKENEQAREAAVVEKAADAAVIDIPEAMIDSETGYMLRDFENRLRMQGMNLELYYQFSGQDEAALRSQMRADAEKRVRNNLVLEQIAKLEGIEAGEADLNEELENLSKQYSRSVEELRTLFTSNGNLENIKEDLVLRKTIKFLLENSKAASEVA
ncbi:trigger factor [Paenibacillus sp. sptzw28]|uniref:trigger factor n=1 Tax=Paenibacillus sp. sptzw28 TaxID=715179 RepID=UPI001C6E5015|nr:trigger factor [Paenibacillus sp. sptzw28]QYR23353.1 trigger factor [Paenibacillus sp. sptzw28]